MTLPAARPSDSAPSTAASVAVLAGGQSLRMGQDKSFVTLAGRPLVEHTLERVARLGLPVHIITNLPERYAQYGLPMFADVIPAKGSLGGLYTALTYSSTAWTLCVACDMPFLNEALLEDLLARRDICDAVVPVVAARPQSLHAIYHQRCLGSIHDALVRDDLKIQRLFGRISVHFVAEAHLRAFDPDLRSFVNVNTPDELARARAITSTADPD